ncbi:MAG: DUF1553 domain-containing protein [Verrucomicrobia bacterium]|nr:DUF1553 domain-containing protein [Verrucomicrobiota bacterium]
MAFIFALLLGGTLSVFCDDASADNLAFFERKIRPLLADNCYQCHSAESEKLKGSLLLDTREGVLKGGDTGPAIVPGEPEQSLLIKAVRYADKDLQMPPKNKKLFDRQIADLTQWVKSGAPWPASDKANTTRAPKTAFEITEKDHAYWAFQPIQKPALTALSSKARRANPIDTFVLAKLGAKNLKPNPPATKRELIRRAYFDLIGLPPSFEEVRAFENDASPRAYEKLIDHLLSLPQYGERWGRHWLDVVRFAQTTGYERDGEKPLTWRYRDYVIKAFNDDKPYDQFIREQLAGDELDRVTHDSLIATGFYRLGVFDDEPDDKRMAVFDELDDVIVTTGAAFLGLTLGCARCHDHKFDPISQKDYYSLLAFIRGVRSYEAPKYTLDSAAYMPLVESAVIHQWQAAQQAKLNPLAAQLAASKADDEKKKLQSQIDKLKEEKPPFEWALCVREKGSQSEPTHVLVRGNAATPGVEVQPAFLTVLGGHQPKLNLHSPEANSSGRRRALAEWIASRENPLTARVMANRIWQHHFGKGIAKTTSDFGRAGVAPTHPQLLDWLAAEFIDGGWSIKRLHKTIMLSETYRRSSRAENAAALAVDPGNDLLWRQNLRRLEAEAIHDTILNVSGRLNLTMGGRGFFPHLAGEVVAGASRPGLDWEISSEEEQSRRAVYTFIKRTMQVPLLENFDYNNTTSPLAERPVTTVAPQSLLLLNDSFLRQQAKAFAARLIRETGDDQRRQIHRAYQITTGREPSRREFEIARNYLERQRVAFDQICSRLTFSPDVPDSLEKGFSERLKSSDYLIGPRDGWNYYRGEWSQGYESIRTVDRPRGPFALWKSEPLRDGILEIDLTLARASEFAGVLFRARAESESLRGYELTLDPRRQKLVLRRHAEKFTMLTEADAPIRLGQSQRVKIEMTGTRLRVWFGADGDPRIDFTDDARFAESGLLGVKTWGAPLSVDSFTVRSGANFLAATTSPSPAKAQDDSRERALQAFCLLMLNLNELVYVD